MDLSNDLISKFVKITNDGDKKKSKEGTVYGTTVEYDGAMYVKIDGSDLLTPIDTTADIKEGERVTIMIKDHNATVTGNITSPSASSADVKKVTRNVEEIEGEITEFEAIIADVVHVGELDAEVARIDELIAGKATIEDLTATNARINTLQANKADINYLDANFATINELEATHAEIEILDAEVADINTLVNGNLTSDNILSFNITSQNTTMENAFVKDAMIDTVTANKIMSGTIDTNNVTIQSTDGGMLLQGTLLQMKDDNGKVRIQIGKDTGGNFTFILYDESGTGVLIDEEGIKSSDAIADGLIVDAKVADNANISGGKLDIASVITEVNNDNSTTIKSNKIFLDEQNQSLEVAFNSLKTQVETIQDVTIDGDLTSIVEQVQSNTTQIEANKEGISTLVAENAIRTEEIQNLDGEIESVNNTLSSRYSSLEQDVSGFKSTVADTYTTKAEFNNLEVGGVNLIRNSTASNNFKDWYIQPAYIDMYEVYYSNGSPRGFTTNLIDNNERFISAPSLDLAKGETYTLTFWKKNENVSRHWIGIYYTDTSGATKYITIFDYDESVNSDFKKYSKQFTMPSDYSSNAELRFYCYSANPMTIIDIKLEKGNKATAWTPAPQDIQGQIDATNNNLQNNYSTTSAMNSAINQKASEITSSVSATYATKQSVTDVDNKFNNYSTTTQMNSAINQKASEITSSVSATYTTKSEFDNLEIGGTNLMRYSKPYLLNGKTNIWRGSVSWKPDLPFYGGKEDVFWNSTTGTAETWVEQVTSWGPDVTQGKTYTISFDYTRGSYAKGLRVQIYDQNDNGKATIMNEGTEIPANVVQHREIIWTATYTGKLNLCFWNKGSETAGTYGDILFSSIKIEEGNKATAWSPAPQDIQSQIDDTNINLTNNYTTKSELSQTTNSITVKFKESGGYNLVRNGGFIFGMNNWSYTSAYLSRGGSMYTASGYYIDVTQPYRVKGEPIKIQSGKTYIYSAKVWYTANTPMGWYSPLNYITTATSSGTTHENGFIEYIAKSHETIPNGSWVDIWVTFRCSRPGYYHPILNHDGITSVVSFADVMIMEGDVYKPWTPHPYEVYDGVTTIDKNGIRVSQSNYSGYTQMSASGFFVNNGTENVISCTSSGLTVKGTINATAGTFSGDITGATITGGSIDIGGNFSVNSSGILTTNSQIYAQGGIYTYQDIRGLDDTHETGGLTLVSGTGNVAVRTEAVAHSVYIQPASGEAYVTYPSSSNLADLRLKNLFSEQTNASMGNFGLAQLYSTNAYLEFMYGLGVIRVAEANHLYLQCGSSAGNASTEVRCTNYKNPNVYTNIRAYNVCAQNAVYANGVNVSSDVNRKRDIELYETDALYEICTTPVYTYHLDTDLDEEIKRIGIIMQEAPLDAIDLSGKGVDLYQMVTMLWKATQQQQEMIEDLKQQIKGE